MYVQFDLITDQGVKSLSSITDQLRLWTLRYEVDCYRTKIIKGTLRMTFDNHQHYSLFAMTWNPEQNSLFDYRLIEPMKTRQL